MLGSRTYHGPSPAHLGGRGPVVWVHQCGLGLASGSQWCLPLALHDRKLLLSVILKGLRQLSYHLGCIYGGIFDHLECFNIHQLTFTHCWQTHKKEQLGSIQLGWLQYLTSVRFGWNSLWLEDADVVLFENKFWSSFHLPLEFLVEPQLLSHKCWRTEGSKQQLLCVPSPLSAAASQSWCTRLYMKNTSFVVVNSCLYSVSHIEKK